MEENNKSENSLNEKMDADNRMEIVKAEASNLKDKILTSLNLPKGYTVLSVSGPLDEVPLGGRIVQPNVYAVKVQNKKREIETLIVNEELEKIATIKENNQIILENNKFRDLIGEQGKQTEQQKDLYNLDAEYFLARDEKGNLVAGTKDEIEQMQQDGEQLTDIKASEDGMEPKTEADKELSRNEKIAQTLGIPVEQIKSVTRIHDYETAEAIAGKGNSPSKHLDKYVITLKTDSTQKGYNDIIPVEEKSDGTFRQVSTDKEASEITRKVLDELRASTIDPEQEIGSNEVRTDVNPDAESNIEIMRFGDNDNRTIISTDRESRAVTHAFRERADGVLEPLCVEHEHADTLNLAHKKAIVEELPPNIQTLMQDKKRLELLEKAIELDRLQKYYEEKSKNPDYIAMMAGAANGLIIGESVNIISGGMLPGVGGISAAQGAHDANEHSKNEAKKYADELKNDLDTVLIELSPTMQATSIEEAKEEYEEYEEKVPWPHH